MARTARKSTQKQRSTRRRTDDHTALMERVQDVQRPAPRTPPAVEPANAAQTRYVNAIKSSQLTFALGPAGTGKTWVCTGLAAQALHNGDIEKLIITRPAVEAGENLGFLPGELEEKFDPYLQPFRDSLYHFLGKSFTEYLIKAGKIEAAPLAYMRGRTFKNAWVILDEAQNTTPKQMKMFLTRLGSDCKMVVNGDTAQTDINGKSGLQDAVERLFYIPSIRVVKFKREDIVRSGLVQEIVECYEEGVSLPDGGREVVSAMFSNH